MPEMPKSVKTVSSASKYGGFRGQSPRNRHVFRSKSIRFVTIHRIGKLPMFNPYNLEIMMLPRAAKDRGVGQSIIETRPLQR
jgi:hypothetical protein